MGVCLDNGVGGLGCFWGVGRFNFGFFGVTILSYNSISLDLFNYINFIQSNAEKPYR
jgi:hypothetical protein